MASHAPLLNKPTALAAKPRAMAPSPKKPLVPKARATTPHGQAPIIWRKCAVCDGEQSGERPPEIDRVQRASDPAAPSGSLPQSPRGFVAGSPLHYAAFKARLPHGRSPPASSQLSVSHPNDPLEREADRIAEQALSTPAARAASGVAGGAANPPPSASGHGAPTGRLLRACALCEEKEELQRDADPAAAGPQRPQGSGAPPLPAGAAASVARARAGGSPLPRAVRDDLEPRFGLDFGGVRIHDDAAAASAARAVGARAYTQGDDIVFASGQFAPATSRGRVLLAHELAHVAQLRSTPTPTIFRAVEDFKIRGKFHEAAAHSELIFFTEAGAALDADEKAKIAPLAAPPDDMLTLNGFSSEEGSDAANLAIVNARLNAVAAELIARGHNGAKITKVPLPASGKGRIDYRRLRSVEIVTPGGTSAVPSAASAGTAACAGPNETAFRSAEAAAESMIAGAVTALGTAPIPAAMTALLNRFYNGWTPATAAVIKSNLTDIKTQLHRLLPAANHQCATIKHSSCEAGSEAENTGTDTSAMMTMCPSFFTAGKSDKDRGGTLLHEASHGTPGLVTKDKAYAHERLIEFLSIPDALKNSDSYTLLVRLFDTPGSMTVGPASPDPLTGGMTPAEQTAARRAMAWMEKWLIWSYQEMSSLYSTIVASSAAWTNTYYRDTMSLVAPIFGLTAPPALPTMDDRIKVAAIHDRFHIMRSTEWSTAVTLHKIAAGDDRWAPGPGTSVDLGPGFFAATPRGQLDRLLTAIAKATPDVSPAFVPKYVALADKLRTHIGGGSP